ncbi:MAG: efflux RND transporter periplasmic adaptor subunit [Candidatus Sumerlaeia bacterium]
MNTLITAVKTIAASAIIASLFLWLRGDLLGKDKIEPGRASVKAELAPAGAEVAVVTPSVIPVTTEAVGTLLARFSTEISPKILATVLKIEVNAGDNVTQGQRLVVQDDRDVQARLDQARKALEAAEANLKQAEQDYKRHKDLYDKGVESREIFEQYETGRTVARAKVEQARAAVKEAEVMLSYTTLYAPYDGRITDKLLNEGDMGQPGKPILKMYNPQRLRLEANVPESLTPHIRTGQELTVRIDALNLEARGIVEEIVPSTDVITRTFVARVSVPYEPGLYEGMFGRLIIPVGEREALLVPRSAVYRVGQIEMVKVKAPDGTLHKRAVKTGPVLGDQVEILSGLKPGEMLIVRP